MKYAESADFSQSEKNTEETKADKLRYIERQFAWVGEPWHFQLNSQMEEAIKTYTWFKDAKKIGDRVHFNGNTKAGSKAYYWVKDHYIGNMLAAFGKIEICLSQNGTIVSYFNPFEKFNKQSQVKKIVEETA